MARNMLSGGFSRQRPGARWTALSFFAPVWYSCGAYNGSAVWRPYAHVQHSFGGQVTTGQKASLSLLCAVGVTSLFAVAAYLHFFSLFEIRFYQPVMMRSAEEQTERLALLLETYTDTLAARFASFLQEPDVLSVFDREQSSAAIDGRDRLVQALLAQTNRLAGVRIVSENGRHVHFSSLADDVLSRADNFIAYKNYTELDGPSFSSVAVRRGEAMHITADTQRDMLIFAFPVYDSMEVFRGTALFLVESAGFYEYAVQERALNISDDLQLAALANDSGGVRFGFLLGLPLENSGFVTAGMTRQVLPQAAGTIRIEDPQGRRWLLFSYAAGSGCIERVYPESMFRLPSALQVILLLCVCLTSFLLFFLIFSAKRDALLEARSRIKRLELSLLTECVLRQEYADWRAVCGRLSDRRSEILSRLHKSCGRLTKEERRLVDELFDKSWEEIIAVLTAHERVCVPASAPQECIERAAVPVQAAAAMPQSAACPAADDIEELEAADEDDAAEPLEELEAADGAESPEDIAELEPADEPAEAEPAEELDAAEPLEELEAADDAPASRAPDMREELRLGEPELYVSQASADTLENFTAAIPDFSSADMESAHAEPANDGGIFLFQGISNSSIASQLLEELPLVERLGRIKKTHTDVICEHDGIFSIAPDVDYSIVAQDPAFKQLVDSVL